MLQNNKAPDTFLIPSTAWNNSNELFRERDYQKEGQRSLPEWGLNLSKRNLRLLEEYSLANQLQNLQTLYQLDKQKTEIQSLSPMQTL